MGPGLAALRNLIALTAAGICGWQVGALGLRLAAAPTDPAAEIAARGGAEGAPAAAPAEAARPRLPLFGEPPAAPESAAEPVRINRTYRLQGLLAMQGGGGWAVIDAGSEVGLFRPGDALPGGETVRTVDAAGVVIDGPEGAERIALAEPAAGAAPAAGTGGDARPARAASAEAPPKPKAETIERARKLLESVRVQRVRVSSGEVGLRIAWISDDPKVKATGLSRGDIIMAVNGRSVEDPEAYAAVLTELESDPSLTLQLLRGIRRVDLKVEVGDG